MLLPGFASLIIFRYVPMYGVLIAFQRFQPHLGFWKSPWVGLAHFRSFFDNPMAVRCVRNTLILSGYNILFSFPAPVILALLLNEVMRMRFKRVVQTVTYLPYFISTVVIVGIMSNILSPSSGIVNQIIKSLGGNEIYFMGDLKYYRTLFTGSDIWQGIGMGTIIYLAALAGVSSELYEAAIVDGANRFQQMLYITLPGILSTIAVLFILRMGSFMSVSLERTLLMQNGLNMEVSDIIATLVYQRGLKGGQFSFATAVDLMNNVLGLVLLTVANYLSRRFTDSSLW